MLAVFSLFRISFPSRSTVGIAFKSKLEDNRSTLLAVSMKLTRTFQTVFMDADDQCVYVDQQALDQTQGESRYPLRVRVSVYFYRYLKCDMKRHLQVRSMDLNDELGQISHVFTDKTGTLTSNYMEYRKMSINGVAYGLGTTQVRG
jgi:magnesium-transporting ATPase (P-type)